MCYIKRQINNSSASRHSLSEVCTFRKTREPFGQLSNMAGGMPIEVNGVTVKNNELLFQAMRFPHLPELQREILSKPSPLSAKWLAKGHKTDTRNDWSSIRIDLMRWALRVKTAYHYDLIRGILVASDNKPIVEISHKASSIWGAVELGEGELEGLNVLGQLWMEIRENIIKLTEREMKQVERLPIPEFKLFGSEITNVTVQ